MKRWLSRANAEDGRKGRFWEGRFKSQARKIREDKRGRIDDDQPPIPDRLGIETEHWLYLTQHCQSSFKLLVATADRVREACRQLGWKKSHGFSNRCLGTLQLFAAVWL